MRGPLPAPRSRRSRALNVALGVGATSTIAVPAGTGAVQRASAPSEMAAVAKANPFPNQPSAKVAAIFYEKAPPKDLIEQVRGIADEQLALGRREIYVHYPSGMGRSKLRLPAKLVGTARNMNTVAKLAQLAKEIE